MKLRLLAVLAVVTLAPGAFAATPAAAPQVLAPGIADLNQLPERDLAALPGMTPDIAKAFVAKRPFASIVDANAFLLDQKLTQAQLTAIYETAFVPLNLNTATVPEILLVPRIAQRMRIEFPEYRPWKTMAQFDREIGKYVGADETNRLKKYVFIPIDLNTATDDQILSIPGIARRMTIEFKEYRPWKTKEQFDREIGKYVGPQETARLWRYVVIQ
jgi:DNA uptake protein ComE-like DNA-binding protein